jgi:biotin carboxylase
MKKDKDIVVYISVLPSGATESIKKLARQLERPIKVLLLRDSKKRAEKPEDSLDGVDYIESCDFSKPHKIAEVLLPYQDRLLAITCRREQSMSRFAAVLPHVPYLRTPSTESLQWASDKYEMRRHMMTHDPKITPAFTLVKNNSKVERDRVIKKVGFPMIVKPANMVASLFVSICYHESELEQALRTIFRRVKAAYEKDGRLETPRVIAEAFMDGDYYSIDSYVNSRGKIYHCPLVKQVTGRSIGHDDFYNHLQITPTKLKKETIARANEVAEKAIHALGLRSTIAHTELVKIDDEWKVVEIGARMGGFRHVLHQLSCDIDHSLNDILIRIPKKPHIPKKCKGYACAMKWFADKEGTITEMKGIKKIEQLESFHKIFVRQKVGDRAVFARNGGRSVFNLLMYNADRSKLLADIRRVEKSVHIKIASRSTGTKKTDRKSKKPAKAVKKGSRAKK